MTTGASDPFKPKACLRRSPTRRHQEGEGLSLEILDEDVFMQQPPDGDGPTSLDSECEEWFIPKFGDNVLLQRELLRTMVKRDRDAEDPIRV